MTFFLLLVRLLVLALVGALVAGFGPTFIGFVAELATFTTFLLVLVSAFGSPMSIFTTMIAMLFVTQGTIVISICHVV